MRLIHASLIALALAAPAVQAQEDPDRKVAGGGISVPGWKGSVDAASAAKGMTVNDSKFVKEGEALHLTVGPATTYWNPANTASGTYTVKGTFRQPKASASHPHPAGIFIGGKDVGTATQRLVYCVAYPDGSFLVRGFNGKAVFNPVKRQTSEAVRKAGESGDVTNDIAWVVRDGNAECQINGTTVATLAKADLTGPDKLESTDGVWGVRVSHNMDVIVTNLGVTK